MLPRDLLEALQRHVQGELLYVPVKSGRRRWGERSGVRNELKQRNEAIREAYRQGCTLEELAAMYHLSVETVRTIVRQRPMRLR